MECNLVTESERLAQIGDELSEILTAGLQDNGRCEVVGTQSFGKGIIQTVDELSDGSAVKLTILQYFTPSGKVMILLIRLLLMFA